MTIRTKTLLALVAATFTVASAAAQDYSTSLIRPTQLGNNQGVLAGALPGAGGGKSYYFAADLSAGVLQTQIKVSASSSAVRSITLELLGADSRTRDSYYVKTSSNQQNEASRAFPIDSSGTFNLKVTVEGPETGRFCVLLGGSALPGVTSADCPQDPAPPPVVAAPRVEPVAPVAPVTPVAPVAPPARTEITVVPAPPPPPKTVEVVTTRCEQRLRVGSELLFDFNKSAIRPEARPALEYVARVIQQTGKPVLIEGHTDSIGSDAYNMRLSELRALTVQNELARQLSPMLPMESLGYGKMQPIADNQNADGTDNPEGRQRNRRVEIVVNTCR